MEYITCYLPETTADLRLPETFLTKNTSDLRRQTCGCRKPF
jgi:hypothetical protein